jgi:hypothetical protein
MNNQTAHSRYLWRFLYLQSNSRGIWENGRLKKELGAGTSA